MKENREDGFCTGATGVGTREAHAVSHQPPAHHHLGAVSKSKYITFFPRKCHLQVGCFWSKQYGHELTMISKASPDQQVQRTAQNARWI